MFVGHALLAFAIAAALAHVLGWPRERALGVGLAAGAFGMVPDVDVVYAPVGLLAGASPEAFWSTANLVHRTVTHSLVVAVIAAAAVGLWAAARRGDEGPLPPARVGALFLLGGLVVVAALVTGGLAAVVMALFGLAALLVAGVAARHGLGARVVTAAALVGLLTHPFGDLFTGKPPAFLYPLDVTIMADRVSLHPDPTLHLLSAFGVELAVAWLAVLVALRIEGHPPERHIRRPAGLGLGYVALAPLLPAPTLEVSYHFVYSVLAVGLLAALAAREWQPGGLRRWRPRRPGGWRPGRLRGWRPRRTGGWRLGRAAVTGLAAATLAGLAYAAVYLAVGGPTPA